MQQHRDQIGADKLRVRLLIDGCCFGSENECDRVGNALKLQLNLWPYTPSQLAYRRKSTHNRFCLLAPNKGTTNFYY